MTAGALPLWALYFPCLNLKARAKLQYLPIDFTGSYKKKKKKKKKKKDKQTN
jgi:hypothetical protein